MQPSDDSKLLNALRCTSLKQDDITKDQYIRSPLQNSLLYYPGKEEVKSINNFSVFLPSPDDSVGR